DISTPRSSSLSTVWHRRQIHLYRRLLASRLCCPRRAALRSCGCEWSLRESCCSRLARRNTAPPLLENRSRGESSCPLLCRSFSRRGFNLEPSTVRVASRERGIWARHRYSRRQPPNGSAKLVRPLSHLDPSLEERRG